MLLADWQAEGIRLFGPDPNQWEFICPACARLQRPQDFLDLGMPQKMVDTIAAHACISRWTDQKCPHVGGRLLVHITNSEPPRPTFRFSK